MSKIVIIDDDPVIAGIYSRKLVLEGHEVDTSSDGEHGLQLVHDAKPDFLLVDLLLPSMSGIDVIKTLRAEPEFKNLPIVAYSGANTDVLEEATAAGSNWTFSKVQTSHQEIMRHLNELLYVTEGWQEYEPTGNGFHNEPRGRVLIVEDDATVASIVKNIIEKAGYEPVVAEDGEQAREILSRDADFAAGVFDYELPFIKGDELIRSMQADERLQHIPVMIMTGERALGVQLNSHKAGALIFIPKPFERKVFQEMFAMLVR